LKEARKLGFTRAILPARATPADGPEEGAGLRLDRMPDLVTVVGDIFGAG
jgi:DNA repair protein RadA/Sms